MPKVVITPEIKIANLRFLFIPNIEQTFPHYCRSDRYCGVGLGVADGAVTGVALGTIAGVAFTFGVGCGVAVGDGVISCGGVPPDAGTDGVGVVTALGVGLVFGCMFNAFLSITLPS